MSLTTRVGLLAGACVVVTSTGTGFADNGAEDRELQARIAQLEAEVAQLRGDDWLTESRAEEIRSLVQDVLADADTRASLLQNAATSGYDEGFMIASPDGNFSLKLNGQIQTRFIYNNQDDAVDENGDPLPVDTNRWGFENTRTKLIFSGNVAGPDWEYYIEGDFSRDSLEGDFDLDDAYINYNFADTGWSLMMGQFRTPVVREFLVHSKDQLLIERSNVSYITPATSRTQGVALDYRGEQFHFIVSYNDGVFGANTPWSLEDTEFAFSGRAEVLLSGTWDQFDDFTSPRGSETGFLLGVGGHWQKAEYGTTHVIDDNELEVAVLTVDGSLEMDGWNLFGAFYYTLLDNDAPAGDPFGIDLDVIGFVVQGGYYFTDQWEGYARFEYNDFDLDDIDEFMLITFGVNMYYNDYVKSSLDFGYSINEVFAAADITGLRPDFATADQDGQFVVRTQLQLVF